MSDIAITLKLPQKITVDNLLLKENIKYYSFEDRTTALSKRIINSINTELSEYFNYLLYDFDKLVNGWTWDDYSINKIENFMGIIPLECQEQIILKYNKLKQHPILDNYNINLWVLAPSNNFATTSNITAIDPIVFAEISIKRKNYLIPLTQWE